MIRMEAHCTGIATTQIQEAINASNKRGKIVVLLRCDNGFQFPKQQFIKTAHIFYSSRTTFNSAGREFDLCDYLYTHQLWCSPFLKV